LNGGLLRSETAATNCNHGESKVINAAIAGLGRWGRTIVDVASGHNRLRFVTAIEPARAGAQDYCAQNNLRLVDDFATVLADPAIDAVFLATPHSLHPAQVIACAAARKPVFCEKPLALTLADARRMFDACRNAGVPLAVGHNRQFWPSMNALREIVTSGALGAILHAEGHNSNEHSKAVLSGWRLSPDESPGGGMTGAGLHALHALISVIGPVRNVYAQLRSRRAQPPQLDSVSVVLDFDCGASGTLATIRMTPFYWRVHIFGTIGSAEVLDETTLVLRMSGAQPIHRQYQPINVLRAEINAFADTLETNQPFPITEDEVLTTLAAFEAIVCSAERGMPVRCDDANATIVG
jgi:predicted dehydrogenase